MRFHIPITVTIGCLCMALPISLQATTYTVTKTTDTNDGACDVSDCSLREAVVAANIATASDTIVLAAGTYTLTRSTSGEEVAAQGDLDVLANSVLVVTGSAATTTIIDGNATDRIFDVKSGASLSFSNLTLQNGNSSEGGAIQNNGTVSAATCLIQNNVVSAGADGGGGILNRSGATLTVQNCTISGHSTGGIGGAAGGAISNTSGTVTLSSTTLSSNAAQTGGGIYTTGGTVRLTNTTIANNTANEEGGAIMAVGTATVLMTHSTITLNTADNDANASGTGGGIYAENATVTMGNSLIGGNVNTSNSRPDCDFVSSTITSQGYNVVQNSTGCSTAFTHSTDKPSTNPLFSSAGLADNGGVTKTVALQDSSPAVNIVPQSSCVDTTGVTLTTDQRGTTRPQMSTCDSGAYELVDTTSPTLTITGSSSVTTECGASYSDAGATATDTVAGTLTSSITSSSTVATATPGTYAVSYSVTDTAGNSSSSSRTVTVQDRTSPTITITGSNPETIAVFDTFADAGATVADSCDSGIVASSSGSVDTNVVGDYTLTYTATDDSANSATAQRTVQVVDTTAPVISVLGSNPAFVAVQANYSDAGASAEDNYDGDLTQAIVVDNPVTDQAGTYTVTYSSTDSSGNTSTATRNVIVTSVKKVTVDKTQTLTIYYTSGDTQTVAAFATGSKKPLANVLPNEQVVAVVQHKGKTIKLFDLFSGEQLGKKTVRKKSQADVIVKSTDVFATSDAMDEIIVATRSGTTITTTLLTWQRQDTVLKKRTTRTTSVAPKMKKKWLNIKLKKKLVKVYIGDTLIKTYALTKKHDLR